MKKYLLLILITFLYMSISGCDGIPRQQIDDIPINASLLISPDGSRVIVINRSDLKSGTLLELIGATVITRREILFPINTKNISYSKNNDDLLLTTEENDQFVLHKFNLSSLKTKRIFQIRESFTYPVEISDNVYAMLVGTPRNGMTWKQYSQGSITEINSQIYSRATSKLNMINNSLFTVMPYREIQGELPKEIRYLARNSWYMSCAIRMPYVCIQDKTQVSTTPEKGYLETTLFVVNDSKRCEVAGRWTGVGEVDISRDGSTAIFLAKKKSPPEERGIYIIKNAPDNCFVDEIKIKGEK